MRKLLYNIVCSVVLGLMVLPALGQSHDIKFQNISIRDGLSQSYVNSIIQDRQGYIWIATQDGLNQYDGYSFDIYKSDRSDPNSISGNYAHVVFEDKDGYLWVGTDLGLNRYDKELSQFKHWLHDPTDKESLSSDVVVAIVQDQDGMLWVGTEGGGLNQFNPETGKFKRYVKGGANSLPNNTIRALMFDTKGQLWVGTFGGVCIYNKQTDDFTVMKSDADNPYTISNDVIGCLEEDKDGTIWVGTNDGLNALKDVGGTYISTRYYVDPNSHGSLKSNTITSLYSSSFGPLWIGTRSGGLTRLIMNDDVPSFNTYLHDAFDPNSLTNDDLVQCIYEDRSGSVWAGTLNGISRFDPEKQGFAHYKYEVNTNQSIPDKNIWCFGEDDLNNLWVGSRGGLSRIERSTGVYHQYGRETNNLNRPNDNSVLSFRAASDGSIWVGMTDGVFLLKNWEDSTKTVFEPVRIRDSVDRFSDSRTYWIYEDNDKNMWVATREGLGRVNMSTLDYEFFQNDPNDPRSLSENITRCVLQMSDGTLWLATDGGGLCQIHTEGDEVWFERFTHDKEDPTSLASNEVMSMQEGPHGKLWLGTYGGGIIMFDTKTKESVAYTEKQGLANNVVYGVLADDDGNLWISTNLGISRFNVDEKTFRNYEENDGLQSNEFNISAYYINKKGEMFFGGINGFNAFYPEAIRNNTRAPEMVITHILLFNKEMKIGARYSLKKHISMTDELVLDYNQSNLTLEFAALHFTFPEKNQYRYIMEGLDETYNEVGNRRRAYYTNIPPGEYTFRVSGTNSDGVRAEEEAVLKIIVLPPFWLTWWFTGLWVLILIAITYFLFRLRLNRVKQQKVKLERLVNIRTQEVQRQKEKIEQQKEDLQEEKEKAESLLLNILPEETVEELKANGKATARGYRRATVMFTDIKGFTQISENIKPVELVARLDSYFIKFDQIIEKYGIEKIKTIGDAYMCAGGVPIRNKSNPIDTVLAGLEVQRFMLEDKRQRQARGEEYWELRIGIHTGEIIAGVIGTKRFAYDIWGDTVNVSSRMETSCEPGMVNVSGETYNYIEPLFVCKYRGKVSAKNKGDIDMYYVEKIKPELSVDGLGIEPNQKFHDYVNLILYSTINYRHAEKFILKKLNEELPDNLYYHGVHHTFDVTDAVEKIALREGITGEELYLLKTAALYHDAGFTQEYSQNEPIGAAMAKECLPQFGYTEEQIEIIEGLILATAIPHNPKNHLQQIMCDADLDYLGRDDFEEISDSLKMELMERGFVKDNRQWDEIQVKFFNMHKFFTQSSIALRKEEKWKRFAEIEARLTEDKYA